MSRSLLEHKQENRFYEILQRFDAEIKQLKKNYANKIRVIEQSAQPTLSVDGEIVLWRDTDDGKQYLIARANSTDKKIELT